MKKAKLLYCIIPTLMLLGCSNNEEKTKYDSLYWCVEALKEKTRLECFTYTYEKLETYNYDYSYERVKTDKESKVEAFIFNLYLGSNNKYISIIEYNIKSRKEIKKENIYNLYCSVVR